MSEKWLHHLVQVPSGRWSLKELLHSLSSIFIARQETLLEVRESPKVKHVGRVAEGGDEKGEKDLLYLGAVPTYIPSHPFSVAPARKVISDKHVISDGTLCVWCVCKLYNLYPSCRRKYPIRIFGCEFHGREDGVGLQNCTVQIMSKNTNAYSKVLYHLGPSPLTVSVFLSLSLHTSAVFWFSHPGFWRSSVLELSV